MDLPELLTKKKKKNLSNSESDTIAVTKSKSKIYKQKFRNCWFGSEFSPWIARHPDDLDKPYCTYCDRKLEGGAAHLRRHAKSSYHKKRERTHQIGGFEMVEHSDNINNGLHPEDHVMTTAHQAQHYETVDQYSQMKAPYCEADSLSIVTSDMPHDCHQHVEIPTTHIDMSHMEVATSQVDQNSQIKRVSDLASESLHIHTMQKLEIVEDQATHSTDGGIFQPTIIHESKMHDANEYIVEYNRASTSTVAVSSSDTLTDMTSIGPEAGHITVTIQGQDPMYIHTADTLPPEEEQFISSVAEESLNVEIPKKPKMQKKARLKRNRIRQEKIKREHHKRTQRWYKQKYAEHWENTKELANWLSRAPDDPKTPFCIACDKKLAGGIVHLRRHSETPYHAKRMKDTEVKRQLVLTKKAECSISRYAFMYGLSDAAVAAFPDLLRSVFPDSNLCQLLSAERLGVMMLTRRTSQFYEDPKLPFAHEEKPLRGTTAPSHALHPQVSKYDSSLPAESFCANEEAQQYEQSEPLHEKALQSSPSVLVQQTTTASTSSDAVHTYTVRGRPRTMAEPKSLAGKVAIVTGASAGIGAAVCQSLVRLGMTVVGVARSLHKIEELAGKLNGKGKGSLIAAKCDISKDEEVTEMFNSVVESLRKVSVVVHSAETALPNGVLEGSPEAWRTMLDVNIVGASLLTKLAVQNMRQNGIDDGHIVHVNSHAGLGRRRDLRTSFYSVTKEALRALSEALREELRASQSHIRVSSVSPGSVEAHLSDQETVPEAYPSVSLLQAEDVAESIAYVLSAPHHVEINDTAERPSERAF